MPGASYAPAVEYLPQGQLEVGGVVFLCDPRTEDECLQRRLLGMPASQVGASPYPSPSPSPDPAAAARHACQPGYTLYPSQDIPYTLYLSQVIPYTLARIYPIP